MSGQVNQSRSRPYSAFCILNSEFGRRPGYSMAELMIVLIIMVMLVAATLPVAKKVMDDSHVREASRQLNAYFAMAKSRAIHTGRPCGIYFDCEVPLGRTFTDDEPVTAGNPNPAVVRAVTQLHLAEVPAPYSGSTVSSVAYVTLGGYFYIGYGVVDPGEMEQLKSLLQVGEQFQVRFDYKGDWFKFEYLPNATDPDTFLYKGSVTGASTPPKSYKPFQIRRSPKKVGNPLAMPTGTCIDMRYSGVGPSADRFPNQPIRGMTVLFTPNGGVDELYFTNLAGGSYPGMAPNNTLFFLVGKVDKVNDPLTTNFADIRDSNLADPTSLWVTVGRGNGQVTTSENTPDPTVMTASGIPPGQRLPYYLRAARSVATSREQMKGR